MFYYTVVVKACWYLVIPQSQCKDGLKMLNIVISILSTIQQRPVNKDNLTWNFPNPNALIAWTTVNVSANENFTILREMLNFNKTNHFRNKLSVVIVYNTMYYMFNYLLIQIKKKYCI